MALEGEHGIVAHHTASIVRDLDEFFPAGFDVDLNAGRTGVEGVFEKFFDHGCRALHNFSSGDFVGHGFGEDVNFAHEGSVSQMARAKAKVSVCTVGHWNGNSCQGSGSTAP